MNVDLRIAAADWKRLTRHFASSFRDRFSSETGALAIVGECMTARKHEFVVVKILLPNTDDLKAATGDEVIFNASFVRRAHLEMRRLGLAGIATFHTHPLANTSVSFSDYDNLQDPVLSENLMKLAPGTRFISVVVGKLSQCGRVFSDPRSPRPLRQLVVVGEQLEYRPLDGRPPLPPAPTVAVFDRGLALTGTGALSRLSGMRIAVVGASGTGSLVCELLARAGCRNIKLIDHDTVRDINLNRILYATTDDARLEIPKVDVLRRGILSLGIGCEIEPIWGSILDDNILRSILDSDLIFGCVDSALARYLLCELAFRYLLPYIDIGSEIGGDEDGIASLDSRVSYIAPGRRCLTCSGVVTSRRLRVESLTSGEREREVALGYSDELLIKQPAVMDLNMRAASFGVLWLRHLLQPFLREPLPVTLSENAVTYRMIAVSTARSSRPDCPTCQVNQNFGFGDCGPSI